jgi:hypothetical protein
MKPIAECPAAATLEGDTSESLDVADVSVGGIAFLTNEVLRQVSVGARLTLKLSLSHYGEHRVAADVRYVNPSALTGMQFADLTPEATKAIRRYVAELLERGAPS